MEVFNDLTLDKKLQIAYSLLKLDCNSVHVIFHYQKIQVLPPYDLNQAFHSCTQNDPFAAMNNLGKICNQLFLKI